MKYKRGVPIQNIISEVIDGDDVIDAKSESKYVLLKTIFEMIERVSSNAQKM